MAEKLPRLFIGSSTEGLHLAYAAQHNLESDAEAKVWTQDVFDPGLSRLESLVKWASECDFAFLILTADDITGKRGEMNVTARDNVIFELGLCVGCIGRERTFFAMPRGVPGFRLPSDLEGVNCVEYVERADHDWAAALGPACYRIRNQMHTLKPRASESTVIPPEVAHAATRMMSHAAAGNSATSSQLITDWLLVGLITMDLPADAREALVRFTNEFKIDPYTKQFFINWLNKTRDFLRWLSTGTPFVADRDVQFELAASLAQVFERKELETVYATTFDPPGDFKTKFGKVYFKYQEGLRINGERYREEFHAMMRPEIHMLEKLSTLSSEAIAKENVQRSKTCPAKARIVVATAETLVQEFDKVQAFIEFNQWHLEEGFGLRYLVVQPHDDTVKFHLKHLPPHGDNEPILDFIVYNTEVVFGRTNALPQVDEARIRMLYSLDNGSGLRDRVKAYKVHFETSLWREAMPLSELWRTLERLPLEKMSAESREAMKQVGSTLVKWFHDNATAFDDRRGHPS
jgi:hypothetical protein